MKNFWCENKKEDVNEIAYFELIHSLGYSTEVSREILGKLSTDNEFKDKVSNAINFLTTTLEDKELPCDNTHFIQDEQAEFYGYKEGASVWTLSHVPIDGSLTGYVFCGEEAIQTFNNCVNCKFSFSVGGPVKDAELNLQTGILTTTWNALWRNDNQLYQPIKIVVSYEYSLEDK